MDVDKLTSAYGDGWYSGFLAAKNCYREGEDLNDYDEAQILKMSEHAESECSYAEAHADLSK